MDMYEATRKATSLAKSGELDAAIDLLKSTVKKMQTVGGYSNNGYTKIIPYFQKAGRYGEAIEYSLNHLVPAVKADCKITFQQKCDEIQEAFIELSEHQVYDKLRLNAKREGAKHDEEKFEILSKLHFSNYQKLLKIGNENQRKIDYQEILNLFGPDYSQWPELFRKKYADFIKNT